MANKPQEMGEIYFGEVTESSIAYVCKYLDKGFHKRNPPGVNPEFRIMSKGLGMSYLTKNIREYHTSECFEDRGYITKKGGSKMAMPRYYRDKLYTPEQKADISLKASTMSNNTQPVDKKLQYDKAVVDTFKRKTTRRDL